MFQVPAHDAHLLGRELGGSFKPEDLQGLGAFEVVAQLYAAGRTQPPFTALTQPASEERGDPEEVRQRSRSRYGVLRSQVEEAIRSRQQGGGTEAPIGRRRRSNGGQR